MKKKIKSTGKIIILRIALEKFRTSLILNFSVLNKLIISFKDVDIDNQLIIKEVSKKISIFNNL